MLRKKQLVYTQRTYIEKKRKYSSVTGDNYNN